MDNEALTATITGDLKKLKHLVNQGVNINAQDDNGRTFLHYAVSYNQAKAVEFLLQNGVDVLLTTDKHNTALHIAVSKRDDTLIKAILENVAREKLRDLLNAKTKATGTAALHVAAKHNSRRDARILLEYGANYGIKNNAGEKPFDLATDRDLQDMLELINVCFGMATVGAGFLPNFLRKECKADDFAGLMNARNGRGYTFLQVIYLLGQESIELAARTLGLRVTKNLVAEVEILRSSNVDELDECAQRHMTYWREQKEDLKSLFKSTRKCESSPPRVVTRHVVKVVCTALEKAHEVLLMYRKVEGTQRSLTGSAAMKSLEEVLEVLGFDSERSYAVKGQTDCYYKNLSADWKEDPNTLLHLVNMVYLAIDLFTHNLSSAQMFHAVMNDDLAKMQRLLDDDDFQVNSADHQKKTALCHAAEKGSEKMVKLLLQSDAKIIRENAISPLYLAAGKGHAEVVKLLLKNVNGEDLAEFVNCQSKKDHDRTALHVAAMKGSLDTVKILLRYGATYRDFDADKRTPLDLSENAEVRDFLKLVDDCFNEAKEGKVELAHKLKAMETEGFLAVAGTKNEDGQTLAVVAAKANAKNIVGLILRMIREAKCDGN